MARARSAVKALEIIKRECEILRAENKALKEELAKVKDAGGNMNPVRKKDGKE